MRQPRLIATVVLAAATWTMLSPQVAHSADQSPPEIDYRGEIWPILKAKCLECHNPKKRQGSLDMSTRAAMLKGGDSGAALVPGNVQKSLMIELIEFDEMPPRKQKERRVTKDELEKLRHWIAAGAAVPDEPQPQ
jgi:hypothetical protein